MKIVRDKASKTVLYLFEDNVPCVITDHGMEGQIRAMDIKLATHEIVLNVSEPSFFWGGSFTYDTAWVLVNADILPLDFSEMQAFIKKRVYDLKSSKRKGDFTFNGMTVDITDALPMLLQAKGKPKTRKIQTKTGRALLTATQADAFLDALDDHVQIGLEDRAYDLDESVDAATTYFELPLDIHSGWPA